MTSNIAARCTAMSSAIAQIILDATGFARQLRDSRHYINAVNADLLAIKLSLDIARDDFSSPSARFPDLLVSAMAGFLDCCAASTEALHKPIIQHSSGGKRRETWHVFEEEDSQYVRQDIEALRSALDLVLDLVVLLHDYINHKSLSPPMKKFRMDGRPTTPENSVLRRIDVEREHIDALTEGRLPNLYTAFDQLRLSARIILEEKESHEDSKRAESRSDSLEPELGDRPRSRKNTPPKETMPSFFPSPAPGGIGAWIANVLSQKLLSPGMPPDALTLSSQPESSRPTSRERPATRERPTTRERQRERERGEEDDLQSQLTFYAESTMSNDRPRSHRRRESPQIVIDTASSRANRLTQYTTATEVTIFHQNLTNDKIAIAKDMRKQLSRNQRLTVDRKLRDISRSTTTTNVERIFFEGANANVTHPEYGTLGIRAAYELPTDILQLLIEYGADITRTSDTPYYSALHAAVMGRNLENLKFLLSYTTSSSSIFSIHTLNAQGETPLHVASRTHGAYDVAKWLLEQGADVNRETPLGMTPLQVAATRLDSRERSSMMQLLMAYGAEGVVEGESAGGYEKRGKGLSVLGLL
ncbi:ankyrin [Massarina eburnea CBS 473.64]|uniref:Ankyrin n=1 Tax=Massarina eburnea CBS 473.64 TaxID=1395130 RepID=A0A6A6SDF6_9PLEO|nr:ankyrin [Massarina eburnea CBS 473.64]